MDLDDFTDSRMRFIRLLLSQGLYPAIATLRNDRLFIDYMNYCENIYSLSFAQVPRFNFYNPPNHQKFLEVAPVYGFRLIDEQLFNNFISRCMYSSLQGLQQLLVHPEFNMEFVPKEFYNMDSAEMIFTLLNYVPNVANKIEFPIYELEVLEVQQLLQAGCNVKKAFISLFYGVETFNIEQFRALLSICISLGAKFDDDFKVNSFPEFIFELFRDDNPKLVVDAIKILIDHGLILDKFYLSSIHEINKEFYETYIDEILDYFDIYRNNWSINHRQYETKDQELIINYLLDHNVSTAKKKYGDATILNTYLHQLPIELLELIIHYMVLFDNMDKKVIKHLNGPKRRSNRY